MNALELMTNFILSISSLRNAAICFLFSILIVLIFGYGVYPLLLEETGGADALDMVRPPTVEALNETLSHYTPRATYLYAVFSFMDSIFPLAFCASISLLWGWLFQRQSQPVLDKLIRSRILLLPLIGGLCDVGENIGYLTMAFTGHPISEGLFTYTLYVHNAKYFLVRFSMYITPAFLILAAIVYFRNSDAKTVI
jgi:hypothetical protein